MIQLDLNPIPNQSFTINLNGDFYIINIKATNNVTACDISRNNIEIIKGQRCVPQFPLIPYEYLADGNFLFITADDEYPEYLQFGNTQFLVYASAEEIAEIEALINERN